MDPDACLTLIHEQLDALRGGDVSSGKSDSPFPESLTD